MAVIGAVFVGTAVVGAVVLGLVLPGHGSDQGPLFDRSHSHQAASVARDPEEAVSYGLLYVTNGSASPAVLKTVALQSQSSGLRFLGSYVIEEGHSGIGVEEGFDFHAVEGSHPLKGYRVQPGKDVEIVLGLAAQRQGSFFFRSVGLTYEVEGKRYEATFPYAFHLCSPQARFAGKCSSSLHDISG